MIPSEFNQDVMAQRRKLRMLHEARNIFKVGDRVRLKPDSEPGRRAKKDKRPIAGKIVKATRLQSDSLELVVKMDDGRNSRVFATSVVKEEYITEKGIVSAVDNKTGEVFLNLAAGESKFDASQVPAINDSVRKLMAALKGVGGGTIAIAAKKLRLPISDRRFWSVKLNSVSKPADVAKWVRKVLGNSFNESFDLNERDATLDQGLTISKRKAGSGTWIKVERVSGKKYGVFRTFKKMKKIGKRPSTMISVPDEDAFAGPGSDPWAYHKDRESALKLAREISEKTGERVMIEDHKGRNVKLKLAFASQQDASVFMSKFQSSGLFGGGRLGKDLSPAGRMFTRITLKKSPFVGSEAYEQNVEVFPERLKAFLWELGEAGGAMISERDKK